MLTVFRPPPTPRTPVDVFAALMLSPRPAGQLRSAHPATPLPSFMISPPSPTSSDGEPSAGLPSSIPSLTTGSRSPASPAAPSAPADPRRPLTPAEATATNAVARTAAQSHELLVQKSHGRMHLPSRAAARRRRQMGQASAGHGNAPQGNLGRRVPLEQWCRAVSPRHDGVSCLFLWHDQARLKRRLGDMCKVASSLSLKCLIRSTRCESAKHLS